MIDTFKTDLAILTATQIVRKYILTGGCHILDDNQYYRLRERVCEKFDVEFSDVVVVGSGKLGFSIKADKRYQHFGDDSDIDVAVVSPRLFTQIWEQSHLYKKSGAFWPKRDTFFKYLSEGWIRPDKLPVSTYFEFTDTWWSFYKEITASKDFGPYQIRGGLYHSQFFFQEYQKICVSQCIEDQQ